MKKVLMTIAIAGLLTACEQRDRYDEGTIDREPATYERDQDGVTPSDAEEFEPQPETDQPQQP